MRFPVFKALSASVAYVLTHFLTLLKVLWLPALLMVGIMAYVMPQVSDVQMQMIGLEDSDDPSQVFALLGPIMKSMLLVYAGAAIFYPMMMAGVLKHVIRGDAPRLPFYLQYGGDELRLLVAYILIFVISVIAAVVGTIGFMVIGLVIGGGVGAVSQGAAAILAMLLVVAAIVLAIWFALRLSLTFPAVIGARSLGVADSWQVTSGNTFGLFFYWLVWVILIMIVMIPISLLMAGDYLSLIMDYMGQAFSNPDSAEQLGEEFERRIMEVQAAMWDSSKPGYWKNMAGMYLYTLANYGLFAAAGGVAYRYASGSERA